MYRVRTVFSGPQGTPWLSTMFFDEAGGSAQQAANAVSAFWGAVDALMHTSVTWTTEADVSLIDEQDGALLGVDTTTVGTGTGALSGELQPIVSQALIRWRTATVVTGRALRGRNFIPGLTTTSSDDGRLIAASQTIINTAGSTAVGDANSTIGVWHRPGGAGTGLGLFAAATSGTAWTQFASLRSRRD